MEFKLVDSGTWRGHNGAGAKIYTKVLLQISATVLPGYAKENAKGTAILMTNNDEVVKAEKFTGPVVLDVMHQIETWAEEVSLEFAKILT